MQTFEYYCRACRNIFEEEKSFQDMDSVNCPDCGNRAKRRTSPANYKYLGNKFTKDGEGFTSEVYNPKEADIRVKYNLSKYDKV